MSALVYHHTDTARLPWILCAGELRPGRNKIGGFPDPDFLWATISPCGDRTASASVEALRGGLTRRVRFTLRGEDFERWPAAVEHCPEWTDTQIGRLEALARGKSSPQDWRCRLAALPCERWLAVETSSYADRTWRHFDWTAPLIFTGTDTLGVWIGDTAYRSQMYEHPSGATGFYVSVGQRARVA